MESDTPQNADPSTGSSPEIPGLRPLPKNPFAKKWWQLPKTVYIAIAAIFIIALGSTAYLFFAPSGFFKPKPKTVLDQNAALEAMYGPTKAPTPSPTGGVILADGPTPTGTASGSPTPAPDVTVSWLTYTNTAYSYSFKYPPDWKVTDTGSLEPKVPSYLSINPSSVATPSTALTITIASSTRTYDEELALRSRTKTPLTIHGLTASLTEQKDSNNIVKYHVVVKGTKYTYILVGKSQYYSIFTPLYSTFKQL